MEEMIEMFRSRRAFIYQNLLRTTGAIPSLFGMPPPPIMPSTIICFIGCRGCYLGIL